MKKVLVAVDGSYESLEAADYAMSIANKEDAQLIIINVLAAVVLRTISVWLGHRRRTEKDLRSREREEKG